MKNKNRLTATLMALIVVLSMTATNAQRIEKNFNGSWKLDEVKSDLKEVSESNGFPTMMKLIRTDTAVLFDRIFTSMPEPSKQVLKLDGTELVTKKGDNQTTRSLSLSEDKMVMTVKSKTYNVPAEGNPFDYTRMETYELAKDGKSLILTRVLVMPDRTETAKAVYNRE